MQAQNTWKETIEKESTARLHFFKKEYSDEDFWFDRSKYRLKGKPITLNIPEQQAKSKILSNDVNKKFLKNDMQNLERETGLLLILYHLKTIIEKKNFFLNFYF